jgi:hypothetical protein
MGQPVSKEEAVRLALKELGDVPAAELAAFIAQRFGLHIDPRFIPVFKASLKALEQLEQARARAKALLAEPLSEKPSQAA